MSVLNDLGRALNTPVAAGHEVVVAEILTAIGLMSGTSLDGIDVALLRTDGERIAEVGPARTYPYADHDRNLFRAAYRDAIHLSDRDGRSGALAEAEVLITRRHAEAVERFAGDTGADGAAADLVGFHGQTVFHDPARALTVQIGDGQALADRLSVPVVWDFRADDVAAGGQGAPLAPVFHRALADSAGTPRPLVFLNIGGVANVTYVGADGELIAFDTGPGNALLDDWTFARTGAMFDDGGRLAASGTVSREHLEALLSHPFFDLPAPKSLDRNAFPVSRLADLSDADGAATLLAFSAASVARSVERLPARPHGWYASGGGRHNTTMMQAIQSALHDMPLLPLESLGYDGDATEAQAFAFLAVRSLRGLPLSYPGTTGVAGPTTGGRISRPATRGSAGLGISG